MERILATTRAFTNTAETDYDALDAIAREVLMVDDEGVKLTERFTNIMEHGLPPLLADQKRDVLIVGAGIAGLLAGKILKKSGYNVTILESHNTRVGGRIKTFLKTDTHEAPFKDPKQYAEAGAMRIPSDHPLVNALIDMEKLTHLKRPFYNVDVDAHSLEKVNRTRIALNDRNVERSKYENGSVPPGLGFPGVNKKASDLLNDALSIPNSLVDETKDINTQIDGWKEIVRKYDNYSMREYLLKYFKKNPEQIGLKRGEITSMHLETLIQYIGTLQNLTSRLFLSFFHSFIDTHLIGPTNVYNELAGGNYQLPYAVYRHVKEYVVQNARVVDLQYSLPGREGNPKHKGRDGVLVKTKSDFDHRELDREFTADYALITIPFSALRIVSTKPSFSLPKRRAIMELHYDSATKVLLEFSQRWWEFDSIKWKEYFNDEYRGHNSIGGYSTTDQINRFIYFPSHKVEGSTGGVILASYVWSDEANRWDSMPVEERYQVALDGLASIYGNGIKRFYTGAGQTQSWMQDPYVMGEAAVFSPGQALGLHPYIKKPEGNVYFAGEHCSLKHAWIEGAIETAIRAVLQIHKDASPTYSESQVAYAAPSRSLAYNADSHASDSQAGNGSASNGSSSHSHFHNQNTIYTEADELLRDIVDKKIKCTVAHYLQLRLEELGLRDLFSIAGNYTAPFLDTLLENNSKIAIRGVASETVAGYAARVKGIGAVAVTYGAGAFSIVGPIAGSQVEQVPVVLINGAPTQKERLNQKYSGIIYSHTSSTNPESNIDAFRGLTVAAVEITNATTASFQIDAALSAAVSLSGPVYIEVAEDVWRAPCDFSAILRPLPRECVVISSPTSVSDAVDATMKLIESFKNRKIMFWAGQEIHRQNLQKEFKQLLRETDIQFTTTILGKTVLSEDHPLFVGVHVPKSNTPQMNQMVNEEGLVIIGLGAWTTSKDTANKGLRGDNIVLAANGGVIVGANYFPSVPLGEYMKALRNKLCCAIQEKPSAFAKLQPPSNKSLIGCVGRDKNCPELPITYDGFIIGIKKWINKQKTIVVSDAGFSLIAVQNLKIKRETGFIAQATWLAIGYSAGAAIGLSFADPESRIVAIIGDGAIQETVQALAALKDRNAIIFILDNGIYGIEQQLVNPNPLREQATNYKNQLLNKVYEYNVLPHWEYSNLATVFGGTGYVVKTEKELSDVLVQLEKNEKLAIVHMKLPNSSTPIAVTTKIANVAGEDEVPHPFWPPSEIF